VRLTTAAETLLERLLLVSGQIPTPLLDTFVSIALARTIMAATRLEIFEALTTKALTAEEVARRCGTDPRATGKLLFALASCRYLEAADGRYSLAPLARKWMLADRPRSMRDAVLHRYLDAELFEHAEEYVRTGRPTEFHDKMSAEQWDLYQRGQRAGATFTAPEVAARTPVPKDPRAMLDIGGAHGHYSVALCRKHPNLRSTILDLPDAVAPSRPLLEREGMGQRVRHRAGSVLQEDLGVELYDLVFMANLAHHFDDATNRKLAKRVERALKPGGTYVILEINRSRTPEQAGQIGGLLGFYFGITSAGGTWSYEEIASWQREAGLSVMKPVRLRRSPGYGMQAARKTSS
jgi:ubiquinone/menaquinone biosynthesis C-methylase UbiE